MYKIWYGDGSTWTSEDGGPEMAPTRDVQVIVQDHRAHKAELVTGADYYVWDHRIGGWRGADVFGHYDYMIEPGYWKVVLYGRMMLQEEYAQLVREADIEKTGWSPRERRP